MPDLAEVLAPLRADPAAAALLFDFDGTLSPVVDDPAAARPADGVADLLAELAGSYRTVAVISGRPVAFLAQHLPAEVDLSGLYGLEHRRGGVVGEWADAPRWRAVVGQVSASAEHMVATREELTGTRVEAKGLSITWHWRTVPAAAAAVVAAAAELASEAGLEVRDAKMSVELHPPVAIDKGTTVADLASGAGAVLFVGDDVGDVPAFDALAALEAPVRTVAVAVGGAELPDAVRTRAQVVLDSQAEVLDLLAALRV